VSREIAGFLRRIPQSNQNPQPIAALANGIDATMLSGYVLLLQTIGIVTINEQQQIQAASQTAKYTLESLALYVEAGLSWVDDWKTRGVYRLDDTDPLQNGATLLHALETRRTKLVDSPAPSRTESVAQVIIKRTHPVTGVPELLFQYDRNASHYQFIGGRHSDADGSILTTMVREIEEELADFLAYSTDYQLDLIGESLSPPATLSPTFGALTSYSFWFYHMVNLRREHLTLQPEDCWATVEDVLNGYVTNQHGERVPFTRDDIFTMIDNHLPNGLAGLRDSF